MKVIAQGAASIQVTGAISIPAKLILEDESEVYSSFLVNLFNQ